MSFDLKKCFIFDLDGTIYLGNKAIQGTIDFIKKKQQEYDFYFLTNNTSKSLKAYQKKLSSFSISVNSSQIFSPLIPLVEHMKKKCIQDAFVIGTQQLVEYLHDNVKNFKITEDIKKCEAVIIGYDTELTYDKLKKASLILYNNQNVSFLATHDDKVCPTEEGPIPDAGSILSLFKTAINKTPDYIFGKPNKILLSPFLNKYSKEELIFVGDRLYTDFKLAQNTGIDFILVLSGETKLEDTINLKEKPSMIVDDLSIFL